MAQTNESQEQVTVNVETLQPVTRTLMTIGALPTSYLISMTYEEQLLWLQNYLIKTVIPAINNNAEATKEVQDIVMALQDYINDYFNNLDVQEEINNKLEQMAQDGSLTTLIEDYVNPYIEAQNQEINEFKTSVNSQIAEQNAQIQAVTSGSPLVASSVSDMTDTTRVYVNTTDGYWYYYNGSQWVQGGIYQSTGINEKEINEFDLNDKLRNVNFKIFTNNLFKDKTNIVNLNAGANQTTFTENSNFRSIIIPIQPNTRYLVKRILTPTDSQFSIVTSENYPASGVTITNRQGTIEPNNYFGYGVNTITSGENDHYLNFFFYDTRSTSPVSYTDILNSIECYEYDEYNLEKSYGDYNNENLEKEIFELKKVIYNAEGTKNVFNPFDESQYSNILPNAHGIYYAGVNAIVSIIFPLKANTNYTVHKGIGDRFNISFANEYPFINVTEYHDSSSQGNAREYRFSNISYKYIVMNVCTSSTSFADFMEIIKSIKIYETDTIITPSIVFNNILDEKYINLVKNKPVGNLTKGYIALSCDDGNHSLAKTTIPLFKGYKTTYNKNIPLTIGLMNTSQIFSDNAELQTVSDFITNNGSSIAIHGVNSYTDYTQTELYNFLDTQKAFLTNNLTAPTSIIYPNHDYNDLSSTIAGSYYGVCCTGGTYTPLTYNDIDDEKLNGARSNMYTLYRISIFNAQMTTQKIKNAIDYAYDNHLIFMPFFHDNTLTNDYTRNKELLDYCVEYANQKGLEFINIGDIPYIK